MNMPDVHNPPYAAIYDWLVLVFILIPGWVGLYIVLPFAVIRKIVCGTWGCFDWSSPPLPANDNLRPFTWDTCIKLGVVLLVVGFYFVLHVAQHFPPSATQ